MIRALPHIFTHIFGQPLLIEAVNLDHLLKGLHAAMLQRGSSEQPPLLADPALPAGNSDERPRGYRIDRGVAILPVHGVLASRGVGQIAPDSTPLQSYENAGRVLRSAHRDSRVRGILLDIDSPGGEADGVFDLADEIRTASQSKPIWAIAHHTALSAGYVLGAAADRLWTTQTGKIGSLGVVALHLDQSVHDREEGLHYTYLYRGARKIDANPHAPLSPEAQFNIQREIDKVHAQMLAQVARHRRVEAEQLRATEAGIYSGDDALVPGLVDHVGTLEQAHAALAELTGPPRGRTPMNDAPLPAAAEVPADNVVQLNTAQAVEAALAQAREAAELCALAGYPEMAAETIAGNVPLAELRAQLQQRKAADAAARQVQSIDPAAARQRSIGADVEAAAKLRFSAQRRGIYSTEP